jgi:hypothetical protein
VPSRARKLKSAAARARRESRAAERERLAQAFAQVPILTPEQQRYYASLEIERQQAIRRQEANRQAAAATAQQRIAVVDRLLSMSAITAKQREYLGKLRERAAADTTREDNAPLASTGQPLVGWSEGFNARVSAWAAANPLRRAPRFIGSERPASELILKFAGVDAYGKRIYAYISAGGESLTLSGVQEWMQAADLGFRGRVIPALDRYGSEWAFVAWWTWPVNTGWSKMNLELRWVKRQESVALQLISKAEYTLIAAATRAAFARARGGMGLVLQMVAAEAGKAA